VHSAYCVHNNTAAARANPPSQKLPPIPTATTESPDLSATPNAKHGRTRCGGGESRGIGAKF